MLDINNMPNLKDQIDKFGLEFSTDLEIYRENSFKEIYNNIVSFYGCGKNINETEEGGFPMLQFLESFYNAGFYNGTNFGMYAQENFEVSDLDMITRRTDEIADEINNNI